MQILSLQNIGFLTLLVLSFIISENMCFSAEQECIKKLDQQVLQIEEIWKAGKTNEYCLKARGIVRDIKTNSTTNNMNNIASKLFNNLLSKEINIGEAGLDGIDDLLAMNDLAWYLLPDDKASIEERRINALLLCRYLGEIRKELIPNFKPKPTVMNVNPPRNIPHSGPRGGIGAGMNPNAITNPVAKAQYLAAIRENRENGLINIRQQELKSIESGALKTRIIGCIIETFCGDNSSSALLAECINSARLSDQEKEEILKKVDAEKNGTR